MKDVNMSKDQKLLDAASRRLRRMIDQANNAADDYCEAGDTDTSAKLRMVAAKLTEAHAVGRTIKTHEGIEAAFGGDGK